MVTEGSLSTTQLKRLRCMLTYGESSGAHTSTAQMGVPSSAAKVSFISIPKLKLIEAFLL